MRVNRRMLAYHRRQRRNVSDAVEADESTTEYRGWWIQFNGAYWVTFRRGRRGVLVSDSDGGFGARRLAMQSIDRRIREQESKTA